MCIGENGKFFTWIASKITKWFLNSFWSKLYSISLEGVKLFEIKFSQFLVVLLHHYWSLVNVWQLIDNGNTLWISVGFSVSNNSRLDGRLKSPWSSRWCVGLLDEKPGFEPQVRHQNEIRKVFLRRFPLSRFLANAPRVNKIAMKSFSKNLSFGVDFKL